MHYELVKKCRALNKHELLAAAWLSLSTSSSLLKIPSLTSHCPRIQSQALYHGAGHLGFTCSHPQPPPPIQPQRPCNFPNASFPLHLSSLHKWLSLSSRTPACAHSDPEKQGLFRFGQRTCLYAAQKWILQPAFLSLCVF